MPEDRISAAVAGPHSTPAPIVEYEYADEGGAALGQALTVSTTEDQSQEFGFNEVRIQAEVDTHYWIDENPSLNVGQARIDVFFAGVVYHELVNPNHKITFISADGSSEGKLFIRPVKRLSE